MRKVIVIAAALCLISGMAFADVSNEVIVGFEVDSLSEATDSSGVDVSDAIDNDNTLFTVQYTHFFSPLKDDGKPIELRRFYQHPTYVAAGLAFMSNAYKDSTIPIDEETTGSMLLLGGEYFFPTNTGIFLNIGAGSGTTEDNFGGPDTDLSVGRFGFGVRQYIGDSFALHLRRESESVEWETSGFPSETRDTAVTYLGGRGVIADMVGLALEFGWGEREDEYSGSTTKFDVAAVNFEIAGYFGKHFSVLLGLEAQEEDMQGMSAGIEHTTTTTRSTLAATYWFSERFGLRLPIYTEETEHKTVYPGGEFTDRTTNSGFGLYAALRF